MQSFPDLIMLETLLYKPIGHLFDGVVVDFERLTVISHTAFLLGLCD